MGSGRNILKMTKVNGVCGFEGHSLDGALDVEHCINSFGSQFYGDTVHRGGEAVSKDDMMTGKAQLQGQEAGLLHLLLVMLSSQTVPRAPSKPQEV